MSSNLIIYDSRGNELTTVPLSKKPLSGGEGEVLGIASNSDVVVKIFHQKNRTTERFNKIQVMLKNPPIDHTLQQHNYRSLTFPIDIVYSSPSRYPEDFLGYLMPILPYGAVPSISAIIGDKDERDKAFLKTYIRILTAANLASLTQSLHECGYVIGDINRSNLFIGTQKSSAGLVTLIDLDSIQVPNPQGGFYRCTVGFPDYTPPELQGFQFDLVDRNIHNDNFILAVFIFQFIMDGFHPFQGGDYPDEVQNIKHNSSFIYKRPYTSPSGAPTFDVLPQHIQDLFLRCFMDGHTNPAMRPTAKEWAVALHTYLSNLKHCSLDADHSYSNHLSNCPWCAAIPKPKPIQQQPTKSYVPPPPTQTSTYTPPPAQASTYTPPPTRSVSPQKLLPSVFGIVGIALAFVAITWLYNNVFAYAIKKDAYVCFENQYTTGEKFTDHEKIKIPIKLANQAIFHHDAERLTSQRKRYKVTPVAENGTLTGLWEGEYLGAPDLIQDREGYMVWLTPPNTRRWNGEVYGYIKRDTQPTGWVIAYGSSILECERNLETGQQNIDNLRTEYAYAWQGVERPISRGVTTNTAQISRTLEQQRQAKDGLSQIPTGYTYTLQDVEQPESRETNNTTQTISTLEKERQAEAVAKAENEIRQIRIAELRTIRLRTDFEEMFSIINKLRDEQVNANFELCWVKKGDDFNNDNFRALRGLTTIADVEAYDGLGYPNFDMFLRQVAKNINSSDEQVYEYVGTAYQDIAGSSGRRQIDAYALYIRSNGSLKQIGFTREGFLLAIARTEDACKESLEYALTISNDIEAWAYRAWKTYYDDSASIRPTDTRVSSDIIEKVLTVTPTEGQSVVTSSTQEMEPEQQELSTTPKSLGKATTKDLQRMQAYEDLNFIVKKSNVVCYTTTTIDAHELEETKYDKFWYQDDHMIIVNEPNSVYILEFVGYEDWTAGYTDGSQENRYLFGNLLDNNNNVRQKVYAHFKNEWLGAGEERKYIGVGKDVDGNYTYYAFQFGLADDTRCPKTLTYALENKEVLISEAERYWTD